MPRPLVIELISPSRKRWAAACIVALIALTLTPPTARTQDAATPNSDAAASLRNRYTALREQLAQSALQPGLYLESVEHSRTLQGDVYAVVDYPYATVSETFANPANWCEVLILHLNTKYCRLEVRDPHTVLSVAVGKKVDQALGDTHRIELAYSVTSNADYKQVNLNAAKGPLGTKDYSIALEMVAIDAERTFVHIRFSYTEGFIARLATNLYLATNGKDKVGFTRIVTDNEPGPRFIGGLRGVVERNTMRYFLAVDAYLDALATPSSERFEASAERWFAATERYAQQLHEVDHDSYLTMKRAEYRRQQTAVETRPSAQ